MKNKLAIYLVLTITLLLPSVTVLAQCLMVPVPLTERVNNSSIIIEARVLSKYSAWDIQHRKIYTHNTLDVYKVFKGNVTTSTIEIVTQGGAVGTDMLVVTPSLELSLGDVGVFTIHSGNTLELTTYALAQGFIKYDEKNNKAKAVFEVYSDRSQLYNMIEGITNTNRTEIKPYLPSTEQKSFKATPNITSFSPTTISAGTYTLLTINGSNFGATVGSVDFGNADDGGATYITADATLIQSWSNTLITIYVPTGASTANIRVTNGTAETGTAATTLTITYNISGLHNTFVQEADYTADLVTNNGSGGYSFTFNTTFFTNTDAVNRYDEVIEQWRCISGINWNSNGAATTATNCEGADGINVVTFDNAGCQLAAGVLGTAYSYYSACSTGGVAYWGVSEIDVKFDTETNWNFTLSAPGGTQSDFYSVMLHEMGHAHQLGHVPIATDVMYWSITVGTQKRTLNVNNSNAANFVMTRTNSNEQAYNGSTGGSTVANACSTGPMIADPCNTPPTVAYSADQTSTCGASLNVTFTDESLGSPTSWLWDFGDGNTSTAQNPSNNYTSAGGYTVTLTATNANGNDVLIKTYLITVGDGMPTAGCVVSSTGLGAFGTGIQNFTMENVNNTTLDAQAEGGYQDFSCTQIISGITKGETYSVSVTVGAINPENVKIYIDYNDNGIYDAGEEVFTSTSATGVHSGNITIPSVGTVVLDKVIRLRVVSDFNAIAGGCSNVGIGQHEDYGVFLTLALPIELISFDASPTNNKTVALEWKTATQINNDYFTIEKSIDGENWEIVNRIDGAGNASNIFSYKSVDNTPYLGTSFYRLKQTDFDGKFTYSSTQPVTLLAKENIQLSIYPNPNEGKQFFIHLNKEFLKEAKVLITDLSGRTIVSQELNGTEQNKILFEVELSSGFYFVTVTSGNKKATEKLIIQ